MNKLLWLVGVAGALTLTACASSGHKALERTSGRLDLAGSGQLGIIERVRVERCRRGRPCEGLHRHDREGQGVCRPDRSRALHVRP
jgi:hypothetical protein